MLKVGSRVRIVAEGIVHGMLGTVVEIVPNSQLRYNVRIDDYHTYLAFSRNELTEWNNAAEILED